MTVIDLLKVIHEEQDVWLVINGIVEFEGLANEIDINKYGNEVVNRIATGGNDIIAIIIK